MNYIKHLGLHKAEPIPLIFLFAFLGTALFPPPAPVLASETKPEIPVPVAIEIAQVIQETVVVAPAIIIETVVKTVLPVPVIAAVIVVPKILAAHLIIPKINVNAVIQELGVTSGGAMAVPSNNVDVGWYDLGPRPGEMGSAVIGGHNRWAKTAAVFVHLDQLEIGDALSVVDIKGVTTSFVIREMRIYNPLDDATDVFLSESGAHLNLITCSGDWDRSTKSYTKRLIVFTDAV